MDVRNCVKCNKLFNHIAGPPICQNCRKSIEDKFKEVRLYIRKNENASISEVAETCDVEVKQIKQWIREERLSFTKDSDIGIDCENCGRSIKTGRFCDQCKSDLVNNLETAYKREEVKQENPFEKKDTSSKMRYLNKDNL